jgi:tetratricopeptide (TPR) repeat protein
MHSLVRWTSLIAVAVAIVIVMTACQPSPTGDYEEAIADLSEAIQLDSNLAEAYYNRGRAYANLANLEQAIQDYDQAIQLDPSNLLAVTNRGSAYADLGEFDQAIQDYDQAIQLDPEAAIPYYKASYKHSCHEPPQRTP